MQKSKDIPISPHLDSHSPQKMVELSPEELAKRWNEEHTHYFRGELVSIALYQFSMAIMVLTGLNYTIYRYYQISDISFLLRVIMFPPIIMLNIWLYIVLTTIFCSWAMKWLERKYPAREGVFSREFNKSGAADPEIQYYHYRGFLYKWPVFFAKKSIFPWLVNYVLRKMAKNRIGKDVIMGDIFPGLEFTEIEDDVVIMDGASLSSHVVDSIFGNLSIKTITIKKNAIIYPNVIVGPGATVEEGISIGPRSLLHKNWRAPNKEATFFWGVPALHGIQQSLPEMYKQYSRELNGRIKTRDTETTKEREV